MHLTNKFLTWKFIFLLLIASCNGGPNTGTQNSKETPAALLESKVSDISSSFSSRSDLCEELYKELTEKKPALQRMEDDFATLNARPEEVREKFSQYDAKSDNYYASANNKLSTLKNDLLRKKLEALLAKSTEQYANKTAEINSLLEVIAKNSIEMQDQRTALKIILTLPMIEAYQNSNLPDKREFKDLIKDQQKLIGQIDSVNEQN